MTSPQLDAKPRSLAEAQRDVLLAAARRLRPAPGILTSDIPDGEEVNLVTTADALRQLIRALEFCEQKEPANG